MDQGVDALLRVYCKEDREDWPREWPESVGLVCLWKNGRIRGVSPFYAGERQHDVMARAEETLQVRIGSVACFPDVPGYASIPLSPQDDLEISDALSEYLQKHPGEIEQAQEFDMNYEFAESEGIQLRELREEEPIEIPRPQQREPRGVGVGTPSGYVKYDPNTKTPDVFSKVLLRRQKDGKFALYFPNIDKTDPLSVGVLVREDGPGLAIEIEQLLEHGAPPNVMILPEGCLGFETLKKGEEVEVKVTQGDDYLFVTPLAWGKPALPPALKKPSALRVFFNKLITLTLLTLLSLAAFIVFIDEPWTERPGDVVVEEPMDTLKSLLFE